MQGPLGSQNPQKMQMAFTVIIPSKLGFNSVLIKGGKNAQLNNFQTDDGSEQQRIPFTQLAQLFETFN